MALVDLLDAWTAELGVPGLQELGLSKSDVPTVLAGISANSMRTNPVVLTSAELGQILTG